LEAAHGWLRDRVLTLSECERNSRRDAGAALARRTRNFFGPRAKIPMSDSSTSRRRARLMAAVQRGDRTAYRELLDDIGPAIRQFVRRRMADTEDANDVYQDIMMALHGARRTYEPGRPFEPWLFAIARRIVARRRGERALREARELHPAMLPDVPIEADGDARLALEEAIGSLSPAQRRALVLLKRDGLSIARAAPLAGTTIGALKVRAHRAYRVLRRLL
jgi:RNA polymerase sigma-70 factor (ECF subfamily)